MIFNRNNGAHSTGDGVGRTTVLVLLHAVIYWALVWAFWPIPLMGLVFALLLIVVSVVDIKRFEIPDVFSGLLVLTGAVALWHSGQAWQTHLVAAIAFPAALYGIGVMYLRYRGHPGLGLGDVKLVAGLGLWLGLEASVWTLLAASLSAVAVLTMIAVLRRSAADDLMASGVAFGPFLCLFAWAMWLQGTAG